jgi:hypothetical protein
MNEKYPPKEGYLFVDNSLLLKNDKTIIKPTVSNHNKFYSTVLPELCKILFKNSDKKEYNIIIFTHAGFIRNHFGLNGCPLGKLDITNDKRFKDIHKYVPIDGSPCNTHIYTEHIYMKNNKIYYELAKPCDCNNICSKFHQIQLIKQNIKIG